MAFIPVAVAVVVFYTFPILIVLASPFVDGTRLTPALLGLVALALVGVVLVVGPAFAGPRLARSRPGARRQRRDRDPQFFAAARARKTGIFAKTFWIHLTVLPTAALIGILAGNLAPPSALLQATRPVAVTIVACLCRLRDAVPGALSHHRRRSRHRLLRRTGGGGPCGDVHPRRTLDPIQILGGRLVIAAIVPM